MTSIKILQARPYPLGMYIEKNDLIFSGVFRNTTSASIILYKEKDGCVDKESGEIIELFDEFKRGDIYSVRIKDVAGIFSFYQLASNKGLFPDPCSKDISGLEEFGKSVKISDIYSVIKKKSAYNIAPIKEKISFDKSFIYLLHVRGYTMTDTSMGAGFRGTFEGLTKKIPYLKDLGITSVELMPVHEQPSVIIKEENKFGHTNAGITKVNVNGVLKDVRDNDCMLNFWGYEKGFPYAIRKSYAKDKKNAGLEFAKMISAFHKAGIEVILQLYFDKNDTNDKVLDVIRYYVCEYMIDGVHIKGALVDSTTISMDPLLSDIKIFDYGFDYGKIYGGITPVPARRNLAEYKDDFMYTFRRFLKGDDNVLGDVLRYSQEVGNYGGYVHYICSYDGLRLADLVSYEHKHNEANGENNKDGADDNVSWNCGIEGKTRKKQIVSLRGKQMRNALSFVFLSQGIPMIFGGDEFANSQDGNNNPYCQDNEIGWVDWKAYKKNKNLVDFVKFLIEFRKNKAVLRSDVPFRLMDYKACGYPDFSYHGSEAWRPDISSYSHTIGMLYCGLYTKRTEDHAFVYVAYNMHWEEKEFALPVLPKGLKWVLKMDTSKDDFEMSKEINEDKHELCARSICIFVSEGKMLDGKSTLKKMPF